MNIISGFHDDNCKHSDCIVYRKNAKWQISIEEKTIEEVSQIINNSNDQEKLGKKIWDFHNNIINEGKTDHKFVEAASQ